MKNSQQSPSYQEPNGKRFGWLNDKYRESIHRSHRCAIRGGKGAGHLSKTNLVYFCCQGSHKWILSSPQWIGTIRHMPHFFHTKCLISVILHTCNRNQYFSDARFFFWLESRVYISLIRKPTYMEDQ